MIFKSKISNGRLSKILDTVLDQYCLDPHGIHGVAHWGRVFINGCVIASATRCDIDIVKLFALLHDSRRMDDASDPDHGPRAAEYARSLQGRAFRLSSERLDTLCDACHGHTNSLFHEDPTIQACWDADRLDLARDGVWITPDPECMNTEIAQDPDFINQAIRRSGHMTIPTSLAPFVRSIHGGRHAKA